MPPDHGVRLHDDESAAPVLPEPRDPDPQQTVCPSESQALGTGPLEHLQLVSQRQHLEMERGA